MSEVGLLWLQLITIVIFSLTAFAIMTAVAWKSNVAVFRGVVAWFKERRRLREDPAYLLRVTTVATYVDVVQAMHAAHFRSEERPDSDSRRQRYIEAREVTAAFLGGLEGPYLEAVASYIHEDLLEKHVSFHEVMGWLAEDCANIRTAPYLAHGHLPRLVTRFRSAYGLDAANDDKPHP